jgi:hypothetical protein
VLTSCLKTELFGIAFLIFDASSEVLALETQDQAMGRKFGIPNDNSDIGIIAVIQEPVYHC